MKIRTQFISIMLVFGFVLAIISASLFITNQAIEHLNAQTVIARRIQQDANELSQLSDDYLLYRESQQRARWESKFSASVEDVSKLKTENPEHQVLINHIKANQARLQAIFAEVVSTFEGTAQPQDAAAQMTFIQLSWSRMQVQNQGMIFDASQLSQLLHDQGEQLERTNNARVFILIGIFCIFFLVNFFILYRRTLSAIANLQAGAKIIGSGNLDFAIAENRADEIGELSHAFNQMAANLKGVTASKTELEREIAARKCADDALRVSEQRWATTLASIGDAVIATDTAGEITYMNAVAEQLTGWTLGNAETKPLKDVFKIINEYTRQEAKDPVSHALETGMIVGLANHTILVRKDGSEITIDDSAAPIKDRDGKTTGVVLIFRDITERRRAEEQMRLQAAALQAAANAIVIAKLDGSIQWVNSAFTHLTGYSAAEAMGQNPRLLKSGKHDPAFYKAMWETMLAGKVWRGEVINKYKDGSLHAEDMTITPVPDTGGAITHYIAIKQDITERKRAEAALRESRERFRVAQDLSLDAFTILTAVRDDNGRIADFRWEYVNPEAGRILRHPPAELVGQRLLQVLPGSKTNSDLFDRYVRVVETGEPHDYELSYESEGIQGWFRNMTVKLGDGIAVYFSDITARKRAEQELAWLASFPERNPNPIVEVDLTGRVNYFNPAARRLLPDLEARGLEHPWLVDWQATTRALCTDTSVPIAREIAFGTRYYHQALHYLADIGRIRIYGMDITERKKREVELAKLSRTLRALNNSNQWC